VERLLELENDAGVVAERQDSDGKNIDDEDTDNSLNRYFLKVSTFLIVGGRRL
jgi:hypothetical protein